MSHIVHHTSAKGPSQFVEDHHMLASPSPLLYIYTILTHSQSKYAYYISSFDNGHVFLAKIRLTNF